MAPNLHLGPIQWGSPEAAHMVNSIPGQRSSHSPVATGQSPVSSLQEAGLPGAPSRRNAGPHPSKEDRMEKREDSNLTGGT